MKKLSFICTAIVLQGFAARAQYDVQNKGIFFISGSADIVYINASLTNAAGAALTNKGNLYVSQTLSNAEVSMAAGTGSLYLNGVSSQSISGTQPFNTFNLVTNNAAGIVLNNDLSVSGTHTFVNGIISSSATPNYLSYGSAASYAGDNDAGHVSGWVKKSGSADFIFPVGNGSVERPVKITALTATSVFTAHHYQSTANTNNLLAPLVTVDPYEYWQVNRISGGNAALELNWNHPKLTFPQYPLASIRAAYYTGGLWTNAGGSATGDITTTGNITSNVMTAFGTFTFGSISAILPVNFLSTYAYTRPAGTLIEWKTANERNVNHFEVEKSVDGHSFVNIGTVGSQTTPGIGDYNFTDNHPQQGRLWYRIRSVDNDGKYLFSKVVIVLNGKQTDETIRVTNPVKDRIYVNVISLPSGHYNYQLRTDAGQTVQSGTVNVTGSGVYTMPLNGGIRPGIYVLTIGNLIFMKNEKLRIL